MRAIRVFACIALIFCNLAADNWAAEPEIKFNLLTLPASRLAQSRLAAPAQMDYQRAPLRACMAQMSERFQFAYWIDRRVDADQPLTLTLTQSTLGECLNRLAALCDAEVGLVENVITIARPEHLASIQYAAVRLHDQLAQVDPALTKQAQLKPLRWPVLTTPTEMANLLNEQWSLTLMPALPHDLMDAGQLQPCTLATQVTLFYSGFDQCVAGRRLNELRLFPLPTAGPWRAVYNSGGVNEDNVKAVKEQFAGVSLEKSSGSWTLSGPTSAHLRLLAVAPSQLPSRGAQPSRATQSNRGANENAMRPGNRPRGRGPNENADPLAQQRYTISKIENQPVRAVLMSLGSQLGLQIRWDEKLPASAALMPVTFEAKDSRLDDILAQLSQQSKLSIEREGTIVEVHQ